MSTETAQITVALDCLQKIHKGIADKVGVSNKDNVTAIYIISGRILTHCYAILQLLKNGFVAEAGILIRSVYESIFLAEYFYLNNNDYTTLQKWFDDEVVEPKKLKKKHGLFLGQGEQKKVEESVELIKSLYSAFSKYVHPTFSISRINMCLLDNHYDYRCRKIRKANDTISFSVPQLVIAVINMFIILSDIFEINQKELDQLKDCIETLE